MKWNKVCVDSQLIGWEHKTSDFHFFFGNKFLTYERLPQVFPQYHFRSLKQVHGNRAVESNDQTLPEADAHFTRQSGIALVIQTADCLPVLFAVRGYAAAIHAGWRGVEQNIIGHTLKNFSQDTLKKASIAIGPHIRNYSFEVGNDIANRLKQAHSIATNGSCVNSIYPHHDPQKSFVDLAKIAKAQINFSTNSPIEILQLPINTYTSRNLHSFRASQGMPGRQYSFVALL